MKYLSRSLTFLVFLVCPVFGKDPHPGTLRVMSYNVWYVFAKGQEQLAGKKFVKSHTPDVVALQELTNIKPEKLQEFGTAWDHPHSSLLKTSGFSVGLTSRWPIEVIEKRLKGMHHGYLHARSNGTHYFLVHLSPFKWEVRKAEAKLVIAKVKALLEKKEKVIVLGDFNAVSPEDKPWLDANEELVSKMKESDSKNGHVENLKDGKLDYSVMESFFMSGLIDTAKGHLKNDAAHRISYPTGVFTDKKTPPAKGDRIDFILAGPDLYHTVKSCTVVREGIVNQLSDHYPVITDFQAK